MIRTVPLRALLALLTVFPTALSARDLRVRLFTAQLPSRIRIEATSGQLQWRECEKCPAQSGTGLTVELAGSELRITPGDQRRAGELHLTGTYRLTPASAPTFSASFPLRFYVAHGHLFVIATIPPEDYVSAVLTAEAGNLDNDDALKAMAVAIRTYATKFSARHKLDGFDFCDDTHCQVFRWSRIDERMRSAVKSTSGEIIVYNGTPAATYYHQDCGGTIAAAHEVWPTTRTPYLREHTDPYCTVSGSLKWETTLALEEIDHALRTAGLIPPDRWKTLLVVSRSASGRALRLKLSGGSPPSFLISASTLRFSIGRSLGWNKIRSDLYEVRSGDDHVLFSGRGSGHGVGLCQAGAQEMGREGKTYREILSFYYPGAQLVLRSDSANAGIWQMRTSERFELLSTNPDVDSTVLPIAERILRENEKSIGWQLQFRVRLQTFSTLDHYRDTMGEPGWIAASTRGHVIRMQPLDDLRRKGVLESTMRHEFFHLLVDAHARADTPLWFREGLVLFFSDPNGTRSSSGLTMQRAETILRQQSNRVKLEQAYAAAQDQVATLIHHYGKQAVLGWLRSGIPADAGTGTAARPNLPADD